MRIIFFFPFFKISLECNINHNEERVLINAAERARESLFKIIRRWFMSVYRSRARARPGANLSGFIKAFYIYIHVYIYMYKYWGGSALGQGPR